MFRLSHGGIRQFCVGRIGQGFSPFSSDQGWLPKLKKLASHYTNTGRPDRNSALTQCHHRDVTLSERFCTPYTATWCMKVLSGGVQAVGCSGTQEMSICSAHKETMRLGSRS